MITEDRLIGWLCIARHQWSNGVECVLPRGVVEALVERGWLWRCDGTDGCRGFNAHFTDKGTMLSDLNAGDWGINPLREESEVDP